VRNNALVLFLVAVLAVVGLRAVPSSSDSDTKPAASHSGAIAPGAESRRGGSLEKQEEKELRDLLRDYYRAFDHTGQLSPAELQNVEYLIATLPDPIDSSSGYRFDSLLDAIQRAAESHQYVLDRFWFPWNANEKPKDASAARTESAQPANGRKEDANRLPLHQRLPGIVLFRRVQEVRPPGAPPSLLVVFLVGETATRGIHKEALAVSLESTEVFSRSPSEPIRILGPTFSGSQTSFEVVIQEWHARQRARTLGLGAVLRRLGPIVSTLAMRFFRPTPVRVISGSATAFDQKNFVCNVDHHATFHATVNHEDVLREAALQFLRPPDSDVSSDDRIFAAVLHESNTGYGAAVKAAIHPLEAETHPGSHAHSKPADGTEATADKGPRSLRMPFPLHISDIRNAYNKDETKQPPNIPSLPSFAARLRIPGNELGEPDDTEPSLTPLMTAATTERLLKEMLSTITRERIKYVAILATEFKDKVFLSALLRDYCPDVQLVFSGSDLMLTHPDYRAALQGALVVSSYPLYSKNTEWSYPAHGKRQRLFVPSEMELGVYNAAVLLLAGPDSRKYSGKLAEYGLPFQATGPQRPPVWISILGQDGPHPLHCDFPATGSPQRDYVYWVPPDTNAAPVSFRPQYSSFLVWPVVFFVVLCSVVSYQLFRRAIKEPLATGQPLWIRQYFALAACLIPLTVFWIYLAVIVNIPLWTPPLPDSPLPLMNLPWHTYLMPAMCIAISLWLIWLLIVILPWSKIVSARAKAWPFIKYYPVQSLVAALLLVLAGCFLISALIDRITYWPSGLDLLLFVERASDLTGGVSPAFPVFFLVMGFFALGYIHERRWSLVRDASPESPFPPSGRPPLREIRKQQADVQSVLRLPFKELLAERKWYALVVMVAVLFTFCRVYVRFIPSVEGRLYDRLLLLAFALYTLLLTYILGETWLLWDALDKLLREIGRLPLWSTFERLPRAVAHHFGPYLSSPALGPGRATHRDFRIKQLGVVALHYGSIRSRLKEVLRPSNHTLTLLDRALCYEPGTHAAIEQLARRNWISAERPTGQDLHFWLEAESAQARTRVDRHLPRTYPAARQSFVVIDRTLQQASQALLRLLTRYYWNHLSVNETCPDHPTEVKDSTKEPGIEPYLARFEDVAYPLGQGRLQALQDWLHLAEDFLGIETMAYLSQYFVQLKYLARCLIWTPILAILAITSYPFHPQRLLLLVAGFFLCLLAIAGIYVFIRIEKNDVLSRILKSTPNQLNLSWEFVGRIGAATIPVLSVVAAASSGTSDLLHSLLDPLFRLFK
jgi:hypothetical protein